MNIDMIDIRYIFFCFIICASFAIVLDCSSEENTEKEIEVNQTVVAQEDIDYNPLKIPKGDEVEARVKLIKPHLLSLTIVNRSSENIFISFIGGGTREKPFVEPYGLEKKDLVSGEWKKVRIDADVSKWMSTWKPKETFEQTISVEESGVYRLSIEYFVDEIIVKEKNEIWRIDEADERQRAYDKIKGRWEKAHVILKTRPVKLIAK